MLVVGDVMTDIAVQLAARSRWGSDGATKIFVRPGGSAATQALGSHDFGVGVDFVARVGAADIERESGGVARRR